MLSAILLTLILSGCELFAPAQFIKGNLGGKSGAAESAKEITAFIITSPVLAEGGITGTDIAVTVPYGTDVTGIVPIITHTGASINPASGAAQDFTNPVTYRVTAADASTQDYRVTVAGPVADEEDFGPGATINNTFNVSSAADWKTAIDTINTGGPGNYVINLTAGFILPSGGNPGNPSISGNRTVSIRGNHTIALDTSYNGYLLYIGGGTTVSLRGPILQGKANNNYAAVYVSGGFFSLYSGTIRGNTTYRGGGVYVYSGFFTMSGGTISGNTASDGGGGVYLEGGLFTMSGGTISGNTANNSGGGVYVYSGFFTMSGGTISGNTAAKTSSYGQGGGVLVGGGSATFIKTGGSISGNTLELGSAGLQVYAQNGPKKRDSPAGPDVNLNSASSIHWE